jgi:hypothetical protein
MTRIVRPTQLAVAALFVVVWLVGAAIAVAAQTPTTEPGAYTGGTSDQGTEDTNPLPPPTVASSGSGPSTGGSSSDGPSRLAFTGSDGLMVLTAAGALLVVAGGGLVWRQRAASAEA